MSKLDWDAARQAGELLETAALDGNLAGVFNQAATLLDGEMLQLYNFTRPEAPDMIVAPGREDLYAEYILRGWHEHDIYSHRAATIARHGMLITDEMVVSRETRSSDPFFQDFCPQWGIDSFRAWTFDLGGEKWAFTLMPGKRPPPSSNELEILKSLMPAANRSALLACRMNDVRAQGFAQGLEAANRPTLIIDHAGRVRYLTPAAERLVGHGFNIRNGRLCGGHPETDAAFRQLAALAGLSRPPMLENFLIRRRGDRPIVALPLGLRDRDIIGLPGARVILMLIDLSAQDAPAGDVLRSLFSLTPNEIAIAQRLATGDSPQTISDGMGLQLSTVRSVMKAIFAKTGVRRQAELAALLTNVPVARDGHG